ncbi:MAG: ATP phosphoribosyltransferase [Armatimonadetes bacterium]|nr:ATP phosphoribosyltransferase [Armatimonadota bacterium]
MSEDRVLRIGLPKGSLQEATFEIFRRAGWRASVGSRGYHPDMGDPELWAVLLRAQEMAVYVADGVLDCGLTGLDWIREQNCEDRVHIVADLVYAKGGMRPYRWVLAVHESSDIQGWEDLQGRRIATELVNVTKKYLAEHGVEASVEYSWGATEAKCPSLVDAIVEGTETGSTLRANNLRIVEVLFQSTTKLIANPDAWQDPWKRQKIENIALLLQGALAAEDKVGLKMNVEQAKLADVLSVLPALKRPTISPLASEDGEQWVAVEAIVGKVEVRELIPRLKAAGAEGIIEYPLNKLVP